MLFFLKNGNAVVFFLKAFNVKPLTRQKLSFHVQHVCGINKKDVEYEKCFLFKSHTLKKEQ